MALLDDGNAISAVESFRRAIELNENNAESHLGLVRALMSVRPLDAKLVTKSIDRYFSLDPKNPPAIAYLTLGSSLAERGQDDRAIDAFQKAIDIEEDPSSIAWCCNDLARALNRQGRFHEALDAHQRAIRLSPDDATLLANFAWFLANCPDQEVRDLDHATKLAENAIEMEPENRDCKRILGAVRFRSGTHDEAIEILERELSSLNGDSEDARYMLLLAMSYAESGNREKAESWYTKAINLTKDLPVSDNAFDRIREETDRKLKRD